MTKLPKRYKPFGVGKFIGGNVYVHRQYAHVLPQKALNLALELVPPHVDGKEYTLIKYNLKTGAFTFIWCDDFDLAHEPTMGNALLVYPYSGTIKWIWALDDPWIYHHKWLMVKDDYAGFNVEVSKARSLLWTSLPNVDKSRIGRRSYWRQFVLTRLTNLE